MLQKFNYFGQHEDYNIRLCNPNKEQICLLNQGYNKMLNLVFNGMSEFQITVPKQIDGEVFQYYDYITSKRLLLVDDIGYFLITLVKESNNGKLIEKQVTAYSLETELAFKKINLFDGTYKFYDPLNPSNTLLGKILSTSNWTVGNVDSDLLNLYRTFEIPDSTVYEFLMSNVETSYECVFIFDTFNRTVNAYTLSSLAKQTDIILSYNNLVTYLEVEEKSDEIVTALSVYGGNSLGISTVNPLGTNVMYNFDYFANTNWMSAGLVSAIQTWKAKVEAQQTNYSNLLTQYKDLNTNLVSAQSTLSDLKTTRDSIEGVVKVMIEGGLQNTSDYTNEITLLNNAQSAVDAQQTVIDGINLQLTTAKTNLQAINSELSFANNFTESEYTELKTYIIENTYQNESFTTTSSMTNSEIQDMSQQLYNQGQYVLSRVSQPRFSFSVESVNFVFLQDFQPFTNQLEMGSVIYVEKDDGIYYTPILLEMHIELDDPTKFTLTFGNRFKLDSDEYTFRDLFGDAVKAGSSVKFDSAKWGQYVNSGMNNTVSSFISSALDCAKNNVINATNQEILINQNGLKGRTSTTDGYSPNQVWLTSNTLAFTDDNWQTAKLALGQINYNGTTLFGVAGEALVGKIIAGNQLQISNDNNNFVLDSNGAVLNNASFTLVSQNQLSQIILNPAQGINILTRPNTSSAWTSQFYIDDAGNLTIAGRITSTTGSIGGWQIGSDRLYNNASGDYIASNGYGKLSLLSWTPASATFNGNIYASNLQGQVGTTQIRDGSVTASKLDTLYATKAFVDSINADVATIGNIVATKASIDQLNATNATIANLDITNLKFGGRTANWQHNLFYSSLSYGSERVVTSINFTNKTYTTNTIYYATGGVQEAIFYIAY